MSKLLTSDDIESLLRTFFRDKCVSWDNISDHIKNQLVVGYKIELEHVETINRLLSTLSYPGARDETIVEVVVSIVFDHLIEVVDDYDRPPRIEKESQAYYDATPERTALKNKLHRNIQYLGLATRGLSL